METDRKLKKHQRMRLKKQRESKKNISMKKNPNLKSFDQHLDEQYGLKGTKARDEFESGYEAFKLGVTLQQLRKEEGLTQEQLANKCGTTKSYISRIENNASDIRLSTIIRIFKTGIWKGPQAHSKLDFLITHIGDNHF